MSAAAIAEISLNSRNSLSSKAIGAPWKWVGADAAGARQRLDAETSLVERCLRGDQAAWDELVRTHTRRVYAISYRFTGKENEAQDLTQEVFLRVFRTLGKLSGRGRVVYCVADALNP